MNETSTTMTKLYKLRNSIRKLYSSTDTAKLEESIYRSLHKNYHSYIENCIINLPAYAITVTCKPLTSIKTKNDIINTVTRKIKNFIVENSEISVFLEEDPNLIKSTVDISDSFVCDSYIIGDSISFLL